MLLTLLRLAMAADRVELPADEARQAVVVPVGEHGVVLVRRESGAPRDLVFTGYRADLSMLWEAAYRLPRAQQVLQTATDPTTAWLLLGRGRDEELLGCRWEDGAVWTTPLPDLRRPTPEEMVADGTGGLWVRARRGRRSMLLWVDPGGRSTLLPLPRDKTAVDLSSRGDGRVQVALTDRRERQGAPLTVLELQDGAIRSEYLVQPDPDVSLTSGRVLERDGRALAVGTWEPTGPGSGAAGLWTALIQEGAQSTFLRLPFDRLEHPVAFLGDRRQERQRARLQRRQERGARPALRWDLQLHDPVPTSDGWIQVAEAYLPEFQDQQQTLTMPDGRGGTTTQVKTVRVFVGWRFTHALVVGFDDQGRHRWDHAVRLGTVTPRIEEQLRVVAGDGTVDLVYPRGTRLFRSRRVDGVFQEETPFRSLADDGRVKRALQLEATWWHDDTFLVYGQERLHEDMGDGRRVFFLERL